MDFGLYGSDGSLYGRLIDAKGHKIKTGRKQPVSDKPFRMSVSDSLEHFKRATAAAIKAMGHRAELEVAFTRQDGACGSDGAGRVCVPEPLSLLDPEETRIVRGAADSAAARLRYHNPDIAAQTAKSFPTERQIQDVLEQARCEALVARRMAGVAGNIGAFLNKECQRKDMPSVLRPADAPLPEVLQLLAHEKLCGGAAPEAGQRVLRLWAPVFGEKLDPYWRRLREKLEDQAAFAAEVQNLLAALALQTGGKSKKGEKKPAPEQQEKPPEPPQDAEAEEKRLVKGAEEKQEAGNDASGQAVGAEAGEEGFVEEQDATFVAVDEGRGLVSTYRIYTKTFDEEAHAETLCGAGELARLRLVLDKQIAPLQNNIVKLANRLQRRLMARQTRAWDFDLEEGILDAGRLARIVANPLTPLSFKMEKEADFRDTVVSLLIDNSGSMRGRPIALAAICADVLSRTLERCGVKAEVLGFTTRTWKGGKSREMWLANGRPARPGRLNDLLHIVYKDADAPWRRARRALGLMLREGLLKENIDGEALLWAQGRLLARPEKRRILMVISDGAPVDDSTLSANPGDYLEAHLRSTIEWIEKDSSVELVAIGIGHDVTRYYKKAVTISGAEQLGGAMTEQLAALLEA